MNRPDMLLADEPTAALDAAARGTVTRLLRAMADEQGATVVVVTHDLRLRDIADDVVTLRDGVLERGEA
jgi:putative ABC transport system ATP-binding protein